MAARIFVLVALAAAVAGETVNFSPCGGVENNGCIIHEVRITPCSNPAQCRVKLGTPIAISFDYTTDFDAAEAKNSVESKFTGQDVKLDSLHEDACRNTQCPLAKGRRSTYNYSLDTVRAWPRGHFPIKWKLWNASNEAQICCLETSIYLKY